MTSWLSVGRASGAGSAKVPAAASSRYIFGNIGEVLIEAGRWTRGRRSTSPRPSSIDPGVDQRAVRPTTARTAARTSAGRSSSPTASVTTCWSSAVPTTRRSAARSPTAWLRALLFEGCHRIKPGMSSTTGSPGCSDSIRYASTLFVRGLEIEEAAPQSSDISMLSTGRGVCVAQLEDMRQHRPAPHRWSMRGCPSARATATRLLGVTAWPPPPTRAALAGPRDAAWAHSRTSRQRPRHLASVTALRPPHVLRRRVP